MADVSIGLESPQLSSTLAQVSKVVVGEAVDVFELLYLKSDGKYWLAVDTTLTASEATLIALSAGAADEYVAIAKLEEGGIIEASSGVFTANESYCVSSNAGKIAPVSDKTTGEYVRYVGYGLSTTKLHTFVAGPYLRP